MPAATPPRTVALVGGTGFVGSRLAARLAGSGREVLVLTRDPARARHLLVLPTLRVSRVDARDAGALTGCLAGCDAVVNLAGILNERGRDGSGFRAAHADVARALVRACDAAGIRRLVQVSAIGADAASGPSHYLRSKGEAEDAIRGATGLAWTILRPSVIFGPGDSFTGRFAGLLARLPLVFPLAMPGTRFAPVHVDDVVAAILRCLEDPATAGRTYALCGPQVLSLREIVVRIAAAAGLRRAVLGLPRWVARLQAAVMDFVPGKPFSTDNYRSLTVDSVCAESGLPALGVTPRSFDAALPEALAGVFTRTRLDSARRLAGRRGW
jgi:NADH dehydrogenase